MRERLAGAILGAVLCALTLACLSGGAWGMTKGSPPGPRIQSTVQLSANSWEIWIDNRGRHTVPLPGNQPGGFWPKGSGRNYIFGGGIWVGVLNHTSKPDTQCTWGYNPNSGGAEFCPTTPDGDATKYLDPGARVYLSNNPNDVLAWPEKDSTGRNKILSLQDSWTKFSDVNPIYMQGGDLPIGVEVKRITYAWPYPGYSDIVYFLFWVKNATASTSGGARTLTDVILGNCMDCDIGNESLTNANDLIFLENTKYRKANGDSATRNLAVQYQLAQETGWSISPPYFVGFRFFQGPINNTGNTLQIRSQPNIGYPEFDRDVLPGEPLGMTAFQIFTIDVDPATAWARYMELSGRYYGTPNIYNAYQKDAGPGDKRFVQCSGPFNLPVDSTVRFAVAVIGGTDSLSMIRASDWAQNTYDNWKTPVHWVRVASPNGGEVVSGAIPITWASNGLGSDSVDIYFTRDGGTTWDTIATNQPNNGNYIWNTTPRPDGTWYMIGLFLHNAQVGTWDYSDSTFTVNNPGNGPPDVQLYSPFGGEVWSGTRNVLWYARDPDGDILDINLSYSTDGGQAWEALERHIPNTGSWAWTTWSYPNGIRYYLAVTASDGSYLIGDTSAAVFTIDNHHPPSGPIQHDSGGATTVVINPYVVDSRRVTGHRYCIRFLPIGKDTTGGDTTAFYSYDIWDLNNGQRVIANRVTSVTQTNTLIIDSPPVVDGLKIETRHRVNFWSFQSGTVTVQPPYSEPVIADSATGLTSWPRFGFKVPSWPFRGTLFKLTWHVKRHTARGDSIWADVRDSTNQVDVPPETLAVQDAAQVSGWCFGGNGINARGKLWIDSTMASITGTNDTIPIPARYPGTWLTLCGRRYWFAAKLGGFDGRPMRWAGGVCPINDGDEWLIQPSGDRPPHDGDVYTFQTQVGVEEPEAFAFHLGQAYPNPARGGNVIPFSLEKKGRTSLKVYNVAGALVRILVNGEIGAGRYQATWDGRNDRGRQTASGVYLYRLEAPGRTAVKKMVVLR
jgi:hypothetical protein